jgi:hypothetical protein
MEENTTSSLTITDLAVLKNCIDIACSRGAFRAPEMKSVGEVYDKLSAFLQIVVSQAEAVEQAQANPQGETK